MNESTDLASPPPSPCHRLQASGPRPLATRVGSYRLCAPQPLSRPLRGLHTASRGSRAGQGPASSLLGPGRPTAPALSGSLLSGQLRRGPPGDLARPRLPSPQQPDPTGPRSAKFPRPARRSGTHRQGQAQKERGGSAARPARTAVETSSLRCSSPPEAGERTSSYPLGTQFPPRPNEADNTGSRETVAAKPARRPHWAALPPPGRH